ncbi:MAG: MBL fold metallo-hydrolase, partial [Synergistaceae bacterium]|nr:MBL fold metallo-hydrolase [Synergistaceae bacterium]
MRLYFYGADRAVTGSCHCVEANGKRILVDCGLQQGRDELDNEQLPFRAGEIDYVLVTHAHIDHSGRLPLLVKQGFEGQILTTRLTARLLEIMLLDSANIQESEAEYMNRKGERAGRERVEPLYTIADAQETLRYLRTCEYHETIELCEGVEVTFTDAGHLLGSASITMTLTEGDAIKTVVFSGDIGNCSQPILNDPELLRHADYVLMESTYGNRNHESEWSYEGRLAEIIDQTLAAGGNVIIPSFAVGMAQELLYFLRRIKDQKLVKSVPDFPVYIDSPLAEAATSIFCGDVSGYVDEESLALSTDDRRMLSFSNLHMVESGEESKQLNADPTPKVIISASGMCDAGRIRHHLKHNLWRYNCAVVFVGYQVPGTLGRRIIDGAESVKLFGEEILVRAKIVNFKGLSAHADHDHLVRWAQSFDPKPERVFVVHG